MACPRLPSCAAAVLASISGLAAAQTADSKIEVVEVHGNYLNGLGTSDAASQGAVTSNLIESRPTLRPGEVLEFVPGVIVPSTAAKARRISTICAASISTTARTSRPSSMACP